MSSFNRRSFLATSAGLASAVGVGAISANAGAGVATAQGLPVGSSGMVPINTPGLVGVEAPAGGSLEAAGQVRFALPEGLTDWLPLPAPHGGRDGRDTAATGGMPTPAGATGFEVRAVEGMVPLFAGSSEQPTGSSVVDDIVRQQGTLDQEAVTTHYAGRATVDVLGIPVVPRWAWGCDESITDWDPEYRPAQVLTVHHSVTPPDWDTAATMRAFHRYHTLSNGWGDIGYQLVIDPAGVVFQGRKSNIPVFEIPPMPFLQPRSVVGAHVGGNNSGNIGVCLMGNFDGMMPTPAAWGSLVNVLARLSQALNIDPLGGVNYFNPDAGVGSPRWSINGHRDWMSTGCPGAMMYGALPELRRQVAGARAGLPQALSSGSAMPALPMLPPLPQLPQLPPMPPMGS